eukprot:6209200-Pleurochrysis_carterae.AAC.1
MSAVSTEPARRWVSGESTTSARCGERSIAKGEGGAGAGQVETGCGEWANSAARVYTRAFTLSRSMSLSHAHLSLRALACACIIRTHEHHTGGEGLLGRREHLAVGRANEEEQHRRQREQVRFRVRDVPLRMKDVSSGGGTHS